MEERTAIATRLGNRRPTLVSIGAALLVVVVATLAFWSGTRDSGSADASEGPSVVEPLDGSGLARVRLTERAAERIGLQTTPVRETAAGGGNMQTVVPYSALLYDTDGRTWVYTSPEPLAFVRAPVEVERVEGSRAFLSDGPPAGTAVVSVGAALLLGTELGVDH